MTLLHLVLLLVDHELIEVAEAQYGRCHRHGSGYRRTHLREVFPRGRDSESAI